MAAEYTILLKTLADLTGISATDAGLQGIAQQCVSVASGAAQAGAETGRFVDAAGKLREANGQFVATGNSAGEAGKKIGEAGHEADHLIEGLKTGLSIDIGHRLIEGVAEIPRAFQEAIAEGVAFNAKMESLGIQLGGALRSADPGKYLNFSEARAAGEETLEKLRVKANELGTDFHALAETFAINVPVLAHAGIKDVQDQIDAITLLNQVAASKGINGNQAQRDIIDILNGTGNRTILGKELETQGISNESIKQAEQMGTLMDLLRDKLGAYGEAGRAAADTFTAAQQRLRNETEQLYGEISKPVFDEIKAAYDTMAAEIEKPEVANALKGLGYAAAGVVDVGAGLVEFAVRNAAVLVPLGSAVGVVTFALAAYKTAQLASIIGTRLTTLVAETEATTAQAAAVTGETVAIEANTAAKAANVGAGAGGVALNAGTVAAGATAAVGGYLVGSAIRGAYDKAQDDDREQTGDVLNQDINKTVGLQRDIHDATTVEEQLKKRQELTDHLADAEKRLKEASDAISEKTGHSDDAENQYVSPEELARVENLKNTIQSIKVTIDQINRLSPEEAAGAASQRAADALAKSDAAAQARYDASAEGRLEKAQADGDQGGIDDAKYDLAVDKRRGKLEKEGFSPDKAEQLAQGQESASEDSKEREKDAKDEEALRKRAQAEADEWTERDGKETEADEKKAAAARQQAADDAKQRADAIAAVNDQIAINRALAAGDKDGAAALEKKRDIQREIVRLMKEGLSYDEASKTATDEVNTANAAQDRADADRASKRRGTGEADRTTYGYTDPIKDTPNTLHTGHTRTETLDGKPSADRFANAPDAVTAALDKPAGDPAIAANAKDYVPSFPAFDPSFAGNPLGGLLAGSALFPTPTATAGLGAATANLGPELGPNAKGDGGSASALAGVKSSADGLKGTLDTLKTAADAAATALKAVQPSSGPGGGGGGSPDLTAIANQVASLTSGFGLLINGA